jgi:hypothetical protein
VTAFLFTLEAADGAPAEPPTIPLGDLKLARW